MTDKCKSNMVISYVQLRRLIGILGMVLPFACAIGGILITHISILSSISGYYYTNMRDVLVGILIGVSMFLVTYNGYDKRDEFVTNGAGIAGVGIAIFPTNLRGEPLLKVGVFQLTSRTSNMVHSLCAAVFFGLLAYMSICLFTLSDPNKEKSKNKKRRDKIYIACGCIMILGLIGTILSVFLMSGDAREHTKIIFILETFMLEAFGISWLVKGKTILRDK